MKYPLTLKSLFTCLCVVAFWAFARPGQSQTSDISSQQNKNEVIIDWLKDLYEPGISIADDDILINEESARLLADVNYRKLMYPETYTWGIAMEFIKKQELNQAFWYFMNLYRINDQNKELVVKSILTYDRIFNMDKILVSTFYTYCYMDPEVAVIVDGKSEITAPHIMEEKLAVLKEMLFYLDKFKEDSDSPKNN